MYICTLNGGSNEAEYRRPGDRLETPQLAAGSKEEVDCEKEDSEHWDQRAQEDRRRDAHYNKDRQDLPDEHHQQAEIVRQEQVQQVHVTREAIQHAADRRRVEEAHRCSHQTLCPSKR